MARAVLRRSTHKSILRDISTRCRSNLVQFRLNYDSLVFLVAIPYNWRAKVQTVPFTAL